MALEIATFKLRIRYRSKHREQVDRAARLRETTVLLNLWYSPNAGRTLNSRFSPAASFLSPSPAIKLEKLSEHTSDQERKINRLIGCAGCFVGFTRDTDYPRSWAVWG